MKKALTVILGLMSASVLANAPIALTPSSNAPLLSLGVYDVSTKVPTALVGEQYSVSNGNHRLCWVAFNMPFQAQNIVIEQFISPAKAVFADPNASVDSSEDGKTHFIRSTLASKNNEAIEKCWKFDQTDPIGVYQLHVEVNGIHFNAGTFELVK